MRNASLSSTDRIRLYDSPGWSHCEARIRDFELAWQQGRTPRIEDFVDSDDTLRSGLLAELVHVDLEFRLKADESVCVEQYLSAFPELIGQRDDILDLIATEFELLTRSGRKSTIEQYEGRFPQYASDLRLRLQPQIAAGTKRSFLDAQPWPEVPGYTIVGQLGRGGMGIVYKALESNLHRHVALKFLPAEFLQDPERLQRFRREARTASALNHPHICTVHALDEHDGRPFIVMELVEGQTLREILQRRPSVSQTMSLVRQVAEALAAAHEAGVVHRDIKPENVMVRGDGYVKVLDFGLARRLPTLVPAGGSAASDTEPGGLLGTVAYMSPEQTQGRQVEAPSDVFSLGVVVYQLTTGKHPFECDSALETMQAIAGRQALRPSLLNPELSSALDGLIEAMLHKDSGLRPTAQEVQAALADLPSQNRVSSPRAHQSTAIVRRQQELAALHTAFDAAASGRGSFICIGGEPGIGKTTLAEEFLTELSTVAASPWIAAGNCSERLSASEAYMPVLDALDNLLREDGSGTVARLLKLAAPDWSRQLAWSGARTAVGSTGDSAALSQQSMLRAFTGLVQELSRLKPLVLFLDDVHWADTATVDLLAYLGQRCSGMQVLVIATYRPTEMLLGPHPFHRLKLELQGKGICRDLVVDFLSRSDIDTYLELALPGHQLPTSFGDAIHAQTEGSPLFVADLVRYLKERRVIAQVEGHWRLVRDLPDVRQGLPESVRSMIERKLDGLSDPERRLLAAASIYGREFDGAILCRAMKCDAAEVEEQLQSLDRVHRLVQLVREVELPDKTLTVRYEFVHVLYQQALAAELPPARRAALAISIAEALEAAYGESRAADLAHLYEVGRDVWHSARYFFFAAQHAARVFAHREAAGLARRGLEKLASLGESPERTALELSLQTTLGLQLQVTEGYAAAAAGEAYERARRLCKRSGSLEQRFPVLWGSWLFHKVRSDLPKAAEMANELFDLARQLNNPSLALQAHQAMGMTAFCRGEQTTALRHVEQVAVLYDPARHRAHSFQFGQDPGVICKAFGAVSLWLLGYPDAARRQSEQAIDMSRGQSANSRAVALHFAAMVYQLCGDIENTRRCAGTSIAISIEHGFSFWLAGGHVLCGWAEAAGGNGGAGIPRIRRGISDWDATGSVTYRTYYLGLLAETLVQCGRFAEAQNLLDEALLLVTKTDERLYEPELYRLRAEAYLRANAQHAPDALQSAIDDLNLALQTSRQQETKSMGLRAAHTLTALAPSPSQRSAGRQILQETHDWFTQGLDTRDLRGAQELLKAPA